MKTYIILGLSKSGTAVSRFLHKLGFSVKATDRTPLEQNPEAQILKSEGMEVVCGDHPVSWLDGDVIVVKNPGIPYSIPFLTEAARQNIPIYSEIEIAYQHLQSPLIGITATNGKTTTTTLIRDILASGSLNPHIAGNIGVPLSDVIQCAKKDEPIVCELSSFQLMGTERFAPDVAVMLNITPAHLDYHSSFEEYVNAKAAIALNQNKNQWFIYNMDDPIIADIQKKTSSQGIPFSTSRPLFQGASVIEGMICYNGEPIMPLEDVALKGTHNLENILASVAVAKLFNLSNQAILTVLNTFTGVKHRFQLVDSINGVAYYNDSKATNPLASTKALDVFTQPIHWICGGLDRGNSFDEIIPYLKHVTCVYAYGETKSRLAETVSAYVEHVHICHTLDEAAALASAGAKEHEVVLLSPACASWDQFPSFEARGDAFIDFVQKIREELNVNN